MENIRTIKYLTQDELKRLLQVINSKRDKAIFTVAYHHGLRCCEIGMLKLENIDLDTGRIRVYRAKNSLGGEYLMQPDEIKAIKAWLRQRDDKDGPYYTRYHYNPYLFPSERGLPISRRMLDYLFKKYGARAGIPKDKRHFHVLKHSIATHLLEAGADLRFVQDWIGHKNIQNTVVYTQITNRARDEQSVKLFASPLIVKT